MLKLRKSILGAALLAGLTVTAAVPTQSALARPVFAPRGHWVHGWHDGRFGWWWTGPGFWYWYPAPDYYYGPPPADYVGPAPQAMWYYCDAAKGYYPTIPSCPTGWRAVPATSTEPPSEPPGTPPPGANKS